MPRGAALAEHLQLAGVRPQLKGSVGWPLTNALRRADDVDSPVTRTLELTSRLSDRACS